MGVSTIINLGRIWMLCLGQVMMVLVREGYSEAKVCFNDCCFYCDDSLLCSIL